MNGTTATKSPVTLLVMALLFAFVIGMAAQNPPAGRQMGTLRGMAGPCPMMGGPGGAQHQQMTKLMDQVSKSAAALQKETNLKALKKKVAEHAALVKQLEAQFEQCATACAGVMPPAAAPQKSN